MSINLVSISGNLTRDAEIRTTKSGMAVLSFSVAVNDRRKNSQTGEWENYANYVECTMFGSRAESVGQYLSKGTHVSIAGKLRYETWETDGQKRSKLSVVVNDVDFRRSGGSANGGTETASSVTQDALYDDDVPF